MRKRNIQKIVRFNRKEAQDLAAKAKKACLSEAGLIRLLIRGYEPKEKPDDRFYDVMRELSSIGNNINQLAAKANTLGFIDAPMLKMCIRDRYETEEELEEEDNSIPADPTVRNFSYTVVGDKIYYRENSRMTPVEVSATAENRIWCRKNY